MVHLMCLTKHCGIKITKNNSIIMTIYHFANKIIDKKLKMALDEHDLMNVL